MKEGPAVTSHVWAGISESVYLNYGETKTATLSRSHLQITTFCRLNMAHFRIIEYLNKKTAGEDLDLKSK